MSWSEVHAHAHDPRSGLSAGESGRFEVHTGVGEQRSGVQLRPDVEGRSERQCEGHAVGMTYSEKSSKRRFEDKARL